MDLHDARRLVDAFLDAEWAAFVAERTERSNDTVAEAVRAADAFLRSVPGAPLNVPIARFTELDETDLAERRASLADLARRTLYLVAEHANPLWGRLFAAYAGDLGTYPEGTYGRLLYVADTEAGPRVVSMYRPRPTVPVKWVWYGGVKIAEPGPVVAFDAIAEPTWPPHRAHWTAFTKEGT